MADLKNNNLNGRLTRAFRGMRLDGLQKRFLAAATPETRGRAEAALVQFAQAAQRLRISENAFNKRARPQKGSKPSLLKHLRTPEQFAAVRAFGAAKQALLAINPEVGRRIINAFAAADIGTMQTVSRPAVPNAQTPKL